MENSIAFGGLTARPGRYATSGTASDVLHNLCIQDGEVRPCFLPTAVAKFPADVAVAYVHENANSNYRNFIVRLDENGATLLYWLPAPSAYTEYGSPHTYGYTSLVTLSAGETLGDITNIGNILVVSTSTRILYFRYKTDTAGYTYLGDKLPEIRLQFALSGNVEIFNSADSILSEPKEVTYNDSSFQFLSFAHYGGSGFSYHWASQDAAQGTIAQAVSSGVIGAFNKGLEAGKEYRFYPVGDPKTFRRMEQLYIIAQAVDGTYKLITTVRKQHATQYTPTEDFTNVWFYPYSDTYTSADVRLEELKENELNGKQLVESTAENFEAAMGMMNSFVAEKATSKEKFVYPFFLRYALRMYDGSLYSISAPVLLIPNSGYAPLLYVTGTNTSGKQGIMAIGNVAELEYRIEDNSFTGDWEDLIQGVELFASPPIYPYDQGKEFDDTFEIMGHAIVTSENYLYKIPTFCHSSLMVDGRDIGEDGTYGVTSLLKVAHDYVNLFQGDADYRFLQPAKRDAEDVRKSLLSSYTFYKIASIDLRDLAEAGGETFSSVNILKDALKTLTTQTPLDDAVTWTGGFAGGGLHSYNKRLHIFNTAVNLPAATSLQALAGWVYPDLTSFDLTAKIFVHLKTEHGFRVVKAESAISTSVLQLAGWYYYPNGDAYQADLYVYHADGTFHSKYVLPMTRHDYLNGAYCSIDPLHENVNLSGNFAGQLVNSYMVQHTIGYTTNADGERVAMAKDESGEIVLLPVDQSEPEEENTALPRYGSIFVSETNNPFVFKDASVVAVGADRVFALASSTKALSQGQFGQFPLYAFTSEGIWALETSTSGTYTARQPIARDVMNADGSVTQLDGGVVFPTSRGLMMIEGSQVVCLTDSIDDLFEAFDASSLDALEKVVPAYGLDAAAYDHVPLRTFLAGAASVYDYAHQRLLVYNAGYDYAYAYTFDSRTWSTMDSDVAGRVNSYPEALAMTRDGALVDFSLRCDDAPPGLLVTRPQHLGERDVQKVVRRLMMRGYVRRGHVGVVLYGSRDLEHWFAVASSKVGVINNVSGTPFKWYRLALLTYLSADESLVGADYEALPRLTAHLR